MKLIVLAIFISLSSLAQGQSENLVGKLRQVEGDFWYKINDSLDFKGTQHICTLPVRTYFTNINLDTASRTLSVVGYCLFVGKISDTTDFGISGARIMLLNFDKNGYLKRMYDLGETAEEYKTPTISFSAGRFCRTFTLTRNDILLVGFPGIRGATAFYVGELLDDDN